MRLCDLRLRIPGSRLEEPIERVRAEIRARSQELERASRYRDELAQLEEKPSVTRDLAIHGYHRNAEQFGELAVYGSDAPLIHDPGCRVFASPMRSAAHYLINNIGYSYIA